MAVTELISEAAVSEPVIEGRRSQRGPATSSGRLPARAQASVSPPHVRRVDQGAGRATAPSGGADRAVGWTAGRSRTLGRRRRVLLSLVLALGATVLLGSVPALRQLWWVSAVLGALLAADLGLLLWLRERAARREMALAFMPAATLGSTAVWPPPPEVGIVDRSGGTAMEAPVASGPLLDRWAVTRFLWAGAAAWLLKALVMATEKLLGDTTSPDAARQVWLSRSARLQAYLARQSARALTASAAATAGATVIGSLASGASASSPTSAVPPAATGPVAATAAALPADATYTVSAGDTLGSLARRFGTSVAALVVRNHLADPNLIYVGQVLDVGSGSSVGSAGSAGASSYTVVAGDTLASIAGRFGTSVADLAARNHLADPDRIYVGQVLDLTGAGAGPSGSERAATVAQAPSAPSPASSSTSSSTSTAPSTSTSTAPSTTSSAGATAVRVALAQVGKPYVWAGAGPGSFDCSGLVMYAWAAAGTSLPHYTVAQYNDTTRISASQLQPGDLVFTGGANPSHVTMYIGHGQVVAADHSGTDVRVESVTYDGTPTGYGRVS